MTRISVYSKIHIWSGDNTHHDYSVEYVDNNYKKDIVGFKGKGNYFNL